MLELARTVRFCLNADGPVDAINDFSTHALHHQIAAHAFEHGKHLLTQKPLAVTVKAARRMCEQAQARGLSFGVFENARFAPRTRHQRWLLESGRCGNPQMVLLGNVGKMWAPDQIVAETPWRHRLIEAGGISLDIGVHQLDLIRHVIGEVRSITGRAVTLEPQRVTRDGAGRIVEQIDCDADDTFYATLETERGATGNLFASWGGHGGGTVLGAGPVLYGSAARVNGIEISFDDGTTAELTEMYEAYCDPTRKEQDFPFGLDNSFALAQHDWLQAIRNRTQPETDGREGMIDLACAFAILESSRAGRRVEVEEVVEQKLDAYQRPINEHFGIE
jgi:predicted dehydrogenase